MNKQVILVSGSTPPEPCGVGDYTVLLASALEKFGVPVEVYCQKKWNAAGTWDALRALQQRSHAIVHLQYPTLGYGYSLGPQLCAILKSCFVTIHEFALAHPLRKLSLLPFALWAHHLVLTSQHERDALLQRMPWVESRAEIIPIGSNIKPRPRRAPRHKTSVIYFGLITPGKGVEEFLEFAQFVRAAGAGWDLQVVGKLVQRHEDYARRWMEWSQPYGVQWILGHSAGEVTELLADAGLAYLPYPDGASERRGSLKAVLAAGVPCITTRGKHTPPDLAMAVEFASTPAEALMKAQKLLEMPSKGESLADAAVLYARQFTWEKIAEAHASMYRRYAGVP